MPIIIGLLILVSCFAYGSFSASKNQVSKQNSSSSSSISLTPTPTSISPTVKPVLKTSDNKGSNYTNSNTIDCIGPDGKEFKTSEAECKKLNESWGKPVDYMVTCNVNANCGGGTRRLKKSECDNSTCCQIGSSWFFYTSKDKCTQDQNSYNRSHTYTYPTMAPLPTFKPWPTLEPYPTYVPYASPTPIPYNPPHMTKTECYELIREKYQFAGPQYGCQIPCEPGTGPSSVCDALTSQFYNDIKVCE